MRRTNLAVCGPHTPYLLPIPSPHTFSPYLLPIPPLGRRADPCLYCPSPTRFVLSARFESSY